MTKASDEASPAGETPDIPETTLDPGEVVISQWEFLREPPTREQVVDLLGTLKKVWGVSPVDFADYVQLLPSSKKVKVPHPERPDLLVDEYLDCWTPYFSVAGRLKMLEAAHVVNGWIEVDFRPERKTPTGMPGYLAWDPRLVYREYLEIKFEAILDGEECIMSLGSKPGTAWVPFSGGSQAKGSNPFEKVETAARGRALAAWGFGVLPGSGVASVEEMQGIKGAQSHMAAEAENVIGGGARRTSGGRKTRQELIQDALAVAEKMRQKKGWTDEQIKASIGDYMDKTLGVHGVYDEGKNEINWANVKDGQLVIFTNAIQDSLANIAAAAAPI
jgi:hypothetical protein